jgi:hypothetical protein
MLLDLVDEIVSPGTLIWGEQPSTVHFHGDLSR